MTLFLSPGRSLVFGLFLTTLVLMAQQPSSWEGRLSTGIAAIKSGKATEAIQLLVPVTEEAKAFPPEDVRRVEASIVLGSAYQYHGQLDLAEPLYLAAIQWMEAHRETSDALRAVAFDNLGRVRLEQARWKEAEELLNRALGIYSKTRNDQDPRIANVNRLLGETLLSQGRIADGVALIKHAVDTLRHASDTPIQTLAAALRSLATAYTVQGRYPEAEGLLDEALRMNRQPGQDDLDRADTMLSLGHVYLLQHDTGRAMPLLQKAVHIFEIHQDSHLPSALSELGAAALQEGKFAIAREDFSRALDIDQKAFGWDHIAIALAQGALAEAYCGERDYVQAAALIRQAITASRTSAGESHFTVAKLLMVQAAIEAKQLRSSEADAHYRQALAIFQKTFAANHPDLVQAQQQYAIFTKGRRK